MLVGILFLAVRLLPLSPDVSDAAGQLALALPLLALLVVVLRFWPVRPGLLARVARGTLVTGLALASLGLLGDAAVAFRAGEGGTTGNALAALHEVSTAVWVVGLVAVGLSALLTSVDLLAQAHGLESSRALTLAGVAVVVVVTGVRRRGGCCSATEAGVGGAR
nr:hypothetical protein DA06_04760 [Georgenia sp. SUBG003]